MWPEWLWNREITQEKDFESQLFKSQLTAAHSPNRDKLSPSHNAFVNSSVFNATWIHSSYCLFLDGLPKLCLFFHSPGDRHGQISAQTGKKEHSSCWDRPPNSQETCNIPPPATSDHCSYRLTSILGNSNICSDTLDKPIKAFSLITPSIFFSQSVSEPKVVFMPMNWGNTEILSLSIVWASAFVLWERVVICLEVPIVNLLVFWRSWRQVCIPIKQARRNFGNRTFIVSTYWAIFNSEVSRCNSHWFQWEFCLLTLELNLVHGIWAPFPKTLFTEYWEWQSLTRFSAVPQKGICLSFQEAAGKKYLAGLRSCLCRYTSVWVSDTLSWTHTFPYLKTICPKSRSFFEALREGYI